MRKTWQVIVAVGIVLGIVVSLVTLIEWVSGQSSLPGLISGSRLTSVSSPTPTSTPVSSSPTLIPTASISLSSLGWIFGSTAIVLMVLSFLIIFSGLEESTEKWGKVFSCSLTIQGIILTFGGFLLPIILSGLAQKLLETMAPVPLSTVLLYDLIVCSISLLSAYLVKGWLMGVKPR